MTIREIEVVANRDGFTVGCNTCHGVARPIYDTKDKTFTGGMVAESYANAHDFMHPEHDVIIFTWKRPS